MVQALAIPDVPDVAIKSLDKELEYVFDLTNEFIVSCLRIKNGDMPKSSFLGNIVKTEINPLGKYNRLKRIEDEITEFSMLIQEHNLSEEEAGRLSSYMLKIRAMITAAKNIKNMFPNIRQIDESEDIATREILKQLQEFALTKIDALRKFESDQENVIPVSEWQNEFDLFYNKAIENLHISVKTKAKRDVPISTFSNAIKKTVSALEDLTLAVSYRNQKI